MNDIQKYNKALVPVLVAVALAFLAQFGVLRDMTVKDVVTLLITSGVVYLVPNKKG